MNANKLKLNASKTKSMIIRSIRRKLKCNIVLKCRDGITIECVEKIKYLDIMIDSILRFDDHCDYMLKKIGKKISFLNRIGNTIPYLYTRDAWCTNLL